MWDLLVSWLQLHHDFVTVFGLHLLYEGGGHLLLLLGVIVDTAPVLGPAIIALPGVIRSYHPSFAVSQCHLFRVVGSILSNSTVSSSL